jgi:hypothetical protein
MLSVEGDMVWQKIVDFVGGISALGMGLGFKIRLADSDFDRLRCRIAP